MSTRSEISLNELPDVLTMDELRQVLRIGRATAYELVRRKEIVSIRVGRAIRVPKQAVVTWLSVTTSK
jgi:excisionase family DNA binding protein